MNQLFQEREEEERERREERARLEKVRREERRAKRESDFRHLTGEDVLETSVSSTPDMSLNLSKETPTRPTNTSENKSKTTQAAADTSSDSEKKKRDKFLKEMSKVVVKVLDPYRKKGVKGHIEKTDDFRHLAKKVKIFF